MAQDGEKTADKESLPEGLNRIILGRESPAGRCSDVCLVSAIGIGVPVLMLESATRIVKICKPALRGADFLSILPSYLAFSIPGANNLLITRRLRVLRICRILKLARYATVIATLTPPHKEDPCPEPH